MRTNCTLYAVSTNDVDKANRFAKECGISCVCDSYVDLLCNKEVVYIAILGRE